MPPAASWLRAHGLDLALAAWLLLELVAGYRAGLLLTAAGAGGRVVAAAAAWVGSPLALRIPALAARVPAMALWLQRLAARHQVSLSAAQAGAVAADALRVAAFLVLYELVTRLILALARAATDVVRRIPLLGGANRLGGAVLGLAVCAVELGLLAALVLAVASDLHARGTVRLLEGSWFVGHLDGAAQRAVAAVLRRWDLRAAAGRLGPLPAA